MAAAIITAPSEREPWEATVRLSIIRLIPPQVVAAVGLAWIPLDWIFLPKTCKQQTDSSSILENFFCFNICVVKLCCSCPVKYLFFFVIYFFLLGGLQSTIVPDRPHWESNGRGKEQNKERTTA